MNDYTRSEIWETQVILYGILAFLLFHFSDSFWLHIIGWYILVFKAAPSLIMAIYIKGRWLKRKKIKEWEYFK